MYVPLVKSKLQNLKVTEGKGCFRIHPVVQVRDPDPDPYRNVTDPEQFRLLLYILLFFLFIANLQGSSFAALSTF
jgi:hypothetical protein